MHVRRHRLEAVDHEPLLHCGRHALTEVQADVDDRAMPGRHAKEGGVEEVAVRSPRIRVGEQLEEAEYLSRRAGENVHTHGVCEVLCASPATVT